MYRSTRFMTYGPLIVVALLVGAQYTKKDARPADDAGTVSVQSEPVKPYRGGAPDTRHDSRGVIALADSTFAASVIVSPQTQKQIARIVADLDLKTSQCARRAVDEWIRSGGSKSRPMTDLLAKGVPAGQRIRTLREEAESRIRTLLTPEEARRVDHAIISVSPSPSVSATTAIQTLH